MTSGNVTHAPIIVSGNPRSGTTWMQWCLSQHPRIHIHGQEPNLPWNEMWSWYQRLVAQGQWAARSHRYQIAHYAGSNEERCQEIFRQMYRDYMTGYGPAAPRWGIKSLWQCANPDSIEQFESLWPDTRWVICIRHPFESFNSQKNTFVPRMDVEQWCRRWVASARFAEEHEPRRVAVFQIDRLTDESEEVRQQAFARVLSCVGECATPETEQFLADWPRVHEVKPPTKRSFAIARPRKKWVIERVPELVTYAQRLGYEIP